ncbi:hypothetical protein [Martelella alba]|uniref:Uncharacterized protein n=1 Tax=Martelella alba TaxID=2590451 RepID=A0ABY2SKV7_9HYPH|nr:hypothetical protein [Martelella alba]TKI05965.1 hypothetical protein FCN80_12175 [Martelella alba]
MTYIASSAIAQKIAFFSNPDVRSASKACGNLPGKLAGVRLDTRVAPLVKDNRDNSVARSGNILDKMRTQMSQEAFTDFCNTLKRVKKDNPPPWKKTPTACGESATLPRAQSRQHLAGSGDKTMLPSHRLSATLPRTKAKSQQSAGAVPPPPPMPSFTAAALSKTKSQSMPELGKIGAWDKVSGATLEEAKAEFKRHYAAKANVRQLSEGDKKYGNVMLELQAALKKRAGHA